MDWSTRFKVYAFAVAAALVIVLATSAVVESRPGVYRYEVVYSEVAGPLIQPVSGAVAGAPATASVPFVRSPFTIDLQVTWAPPGPPFLPEEIRVELLDGSGNVVGQGQSSTGSVDITTTPGGSPARDGPFEASSNAQAVQEAAAREPATAPDPRGWSVRITRTPAQVGDPTTPQTQWALTVEYSTYRGQATNIAEVDGAVDKGVVVSWTAIGLLVPLALVGAFLWAGHRRYTAAAVEGWDRITPETSLHRRRT